MYRLAGLIVACGLLLAACGGGTTAGSPAPTSSTSQATTGSVTRTPTDDDLVAWCATLDPDDCRRGLQWALLDPEPTRLACLLDAPSLEDFFTGWCDRNAPPPTTTIPETTVPGAPPTTDGAGAYEDVLLAAEARLRRILLAAHPDGLVTAGVVLEEPLPVDDAVTLVTTELGAEPIAVWRTDWVCLDPYGVNGLEGFPKQASRFAYLDGESVAEARRAAAEASGEPILARDMWEAGLTRLVLESEALREPGVTVAVVIARIPVVGVDEGERAAGVAAIRLVDAGDVGVWPGDLPTGPAPDCG